MCAADAQGPDSSQRRAHGLPAGAQVQRDGGVRFRAWAPAHRRLSVEITGRAPVPMRGPENGWFELLLPQARAGDRYRFVLEDGSKIPDPVSRYQPEDVHGASEVIDPRGYEWRDTAWRGRRWEEAVIYELHVGAFTPEGTFRALIDKLDHLLQLGVTAIELMPVADFPGAHDWGYDGAFLWAPDATYGRPEDLKALIDAAHARGLMVLLDVVYNHLGPEGNYFPALAPQFFTDSHHTPWGAAVNYDAAGSQAVRELIVHNALYWIEEFNFDGLRLDAVHAVLDDSGKHLLAELAERVRSAAAGRRVHLVLENDNNDSRYLERSQAGSPVYYTAQWNDDVHHALHAAATGEAGGYYRDYHGNTERLARALAEGFAFQGERMELSGRTRGAPSKHLPPTAFIAFIQNHDQLGNRAFGERLAALTGGPAARALAAVYLLLPQIPMLFMGEEWAARQPFLFFCSFGEGLADAVRRGRRQEFAHFPEFRDPGKLDRIPDPQAPAAFDASRLRWDERQLPNHSQRFNLYRRLLATRSVYIVPRLSRISSAGEYRVVEAAAVTVKWHVAPASTLTLAANLSNRAVHFPPQAGRLLWHEGSPVEQGVFSAWTVRWTLGENPR